MGIANVVNMCSHLQNASKASLGLTSVAHTKYNLAVALALHRAGFLTFVTRGGPRPPDPSTVLSTYEPEPLTTANVARQRLWVGLKYSANEPVLRRVSSITTPKRPVTANLSALKRLVRGFDASRQQGLNLGECMFVGTDLGVLESREAVERHVGASYSVWGGGSGLV
ncbi:putative mitochondrial 37s ribosomal protein s8 protein [Eutypa lata UCREL1]|uniref:Putative mitochondrial 37s ribosomal protein s8 protein n=1 Tax=Eutypa lata (strain UCR-EL1) TaxID=1287681 RepID=M7SZX1_EUTLA|nr:putative mitochondrial 37s ribosomal protein s8 protein [Eutypa lata UCREL1]